MKRVKSVFGSIIKVLFVPKKQAGYGNKGSFFDSVASNSIIILVGFVMLVSLILLISERMGTSYLNELKLKIVENVSPGYSGIKDYTEKIKNNLGEMQKTVRIFDELESLSKENAELKKYKNISLSLYLENQQLKNLLGFKQTKTTVKETGINKFNPKASYDIITTEIVGNITNSFNKTAYLKYAEEGLEGSVVYAEYEDKDILIGVIDEVGNKYSKVMLITNPDFSSPVQIIPPQEKAMLQGDNSPFPIVKFFPIDSKIKEGDSVLSADDGKYFPENLLVGYVEKIDAEKILVRPVIDWNRVHFVNILKRKKLPWKNG